jgi:hypothetical protein
VGGCKDGVDARGDVWVERGEVMVVIGLMKGAWTDDLDI